MKLTEKLKQFKTKLGSNSDSSGSGKLPPAGSVGLRVELIFRNLETGVVHLVKGRPAQTLWHLHHAWEKGITTLDLSNTWALRLGAYIHILRWDYGLDIRTDRLPHDGGYHGRYVLITLIEILEVYFPNNQPA